MGQYWPLGYTANCWPSAGLIPVTTTLWAWPFTWFSMHPTPCSYTVVEISSFCLQNHCCASLSFLFFFFSCLAAFWSWLSNSPYWHLVRPWCHVQREAGRGVAFHDLLRHWRKQQPCSTGSFIAVSCPCIWTSCFQISLGLALTVVDWEVSAWLSWNTHGADGNVLSEAFMHMQSVQRKTSQISLLLPAVLRVSCWMDS